MKVWIVQKTSYDYCEDHCDHWSEIVAAYDSEEKANTYVSAEEAKERQRENDTERCRYCTLVNDIDNYINDCIERDNSPDKQKIEFMSEEFKASHDCPCHIVPWLEGDDYSEGVACEYGRELYYNQYYSCKYKAIPVEVQ